MGFGMSGVMPSGVLFVYQKEFISLFFLINITEEILFLLNTAILKSLIVVQKIPLQS